MPEESGIDVEAEIQLDSLDPPTAAGRVLEWSGDSRIPYTGELVFYTVAEDESDLMAGIVVGYFQARGFLGIRLRLTGPDPESRGEVICVFGAEVVVHPDAPSAGMVN